MNIFKKNVNKKHLTFEEWLNRKYWLSMISIFLDVIILLCWIGSMVYINFIK